ncbi:MAG: PAS domain S-box protein [Magnetococcales bacterium]|nr:PAS domain S-box protein [Magnetococcales bacterium]
MRRFFKGWSRFLLLLGIMLAVVGISMGTSLSMLHQSILEVEKVRISAMAKSQERLIVTLYQATMQHPQAPSQAETEHILSLLTQSYQGWHEGLGNTGEIAFAQRRGEQIEYLFRQRQADTTLPKPVPWDRLDVSLPMHRALAGESGVVIGPNYRGVTVLAAYEFIAPLHLGLVVEIDLAELDTPLREATEKTLAIALLALLVGSLLFARISEGVIQKIRISEQNLAITLNSIGDGVIVTDQAGCVTRMNPVAEALTGWPLPEAARQPLPTVLPLINAMTRQPVVDPVAKVIRSGRVEGLANHTILIARDGTERQIADSAAPMLDPKQQVMGVVLVFRDVTEEYRTREEIERSEQRLRDSRQRLELALRWGHMGGWDLDLLDHTANRTLEHDRIFGYPSLLPAWTYAMFLEHVLPEDRFEVDRRFQEAIKTFSDWSFECRIRRVDGAVRWIWVTGGHQMDETGTLRRMAGVVQDITERKQAEAATLREKEVQVALARLGKAFLASQGMSVAEIAHGVLATSLAVTGSHGGFVDEIDPLTGLSSTRTPIGEIETLGLGQASPDPAAAGRLLSVPVISGDRTVAQITVANRERDYTPDDQAIVERIADLFAIVLERVNLERQLRHAGRLEAVGTLAGGIAHDFNNILAIIIGNMELVTFGVSELEDVVKNISDAANRGRDLVRQLLTFSRQTSGDKQRFNPVPLLKEVLKLMRSTLPTSIDIREDIRDANLSILADSTMLYQVIVNLCTNAGQAIGEAGGRITVVLERLLIAADQARLLQIRSGPYAVISVLDTGPGMSPEIMERIFEPFFTTKRVGQGTGLGLAVVHGAVQGCGGKVQVESAPGAGATFRVYLPAVETPAQHDLVAPDQTPVTRGKGRILFVDDEAGLVQVGTEFLTAIGYSVVGNTDPLEVLAHFQQAPDAFDVVITDQTMPGLTGDQLAEKIRAHRPDMPIFLCTGYSDRMTREKAIEAGFARFYIKPVAMVDLAQDLQEVIAQDKGQHGTPSMDCALPAAPGQG